MVAKTTSLNTASSKRLWKLQDRFASSLASLGAVSSALVIALL